MQLSDWFMMLRPVSLALAWDLLRWINCSFNKHSIREMNVASPDKIPSSWWCDARRPRTPSRGRSSSRSCPWSPWWSPRTWSSPGSRCHKIRAHWTRTFWSGWCYTPQHLETEPGHRGKMLELSAKKNTFPTWDRGTMESRVVWTVDLRNSLVLSWRKKPPETTLANTMMDQNTLRYTLESDLDCNAAAHNSVPS